MLKTKNSKIRHHFIADLSFQEGNENFKNRHCFHKKILGSIHGSKTMENKCDEKGPKRFFNWFHKICKYTILSQSYESRITNFGVNCRLHRIPVTITMILAAHYPHMVQNEHVKLRLNRMKEFMEKFKK